MANDWIKMRMNLHEDPSIIYLTQELNLDIYQIIGRLHKLWSWADQHSRDGFCEFIDEKFINNYVDRRKFAEAMVKAGWLKIVDNGVLFPNFDRHNGESAKKRAVDAERKRKNRVREMSKNNRTDCGQMSEECPPGSVTREEKRREEYKKTQDKENPQELPDLKPLLEAWTIKTRTTDKLAIDYFAMAYRDLVANQLYPDGVSAFEYLLGQVESYIASCKADGQTEHMGVKSWVTGEGYLTAYKPAKPKTTGSRQNPDGIPPEALERQRKIEAHTKRRRLQGVQRDSE